MRYMRLFASLTMLLLLGLLAGCGGGGGGTGSRTAKRKVTLQVQWPSTAGKAAIGHAGGRFVIGSVQSILVEVYDGSTRIERVVLDRPAGYTAGSLITSTQTLDLPTKSLTFFANAFAVAAVAVPGDYHTDPNNGQLVQGAGNANNPITGDVTHPVAVGHSIAAKDVNALPNPAVVIFTLDNTIAKIVPSSVAGATTLTLGQTGVDVANTVQALDANGNNVVVASNILKVSYDPSNTALFTARVGLSGPPGLGNTTLTPLATGTVQIVVTDSEVNNATTNGKPEYNQTPIQATITYTIAPGVTNKIIPINVSTVGPGTLLPTIPLYARSVKFTATQTPLATGDTPPADVTTVAVVNPTPAAGAGTPSQTNGPGTIAVAGAPTINFSLIPTGRTIVVSAEAYSNGDGTGIRLANSTTSFSVTGDTATPSAQEISLAQYHITGFTLTPAAPTINIFGAGSGTQQIQVTGQVDTGAVLPIDPSTLRASSNNVNVLLSVPSSPADNFGHPYLLVTGSVNTPTGTPATITVTDTVNVGPPAVTGSTQVTVAHPSGGAGLNIN